MIRKNLKINISSYDEDKIISPFERKYVILKSLSPSEVQNVKRVFFGFT